MQLQEFNGHRLVSVEKDMRDDKAAADLTNLGTIDLERMFLSLRFCISR